MAKNKVSRSVMLELENMKGGHYTSFVNLLDNSLYVSEWIQRGDTLEEDDKRFMDVYRYVVLRENQLFEEDVVYYGFIEDSYLFRYSKTNSLYKTSSHDYTDVNMTREDAQSLFNLSKGNVKKIVDSNGVTVENSNWSDMPF